ncbi:hypothetical protein BX616_000959 [Lobosporangium transversale]|uniref:Uncharacterized protein n=1 Tax=Lobosporangium transversale TaxID=64571 RepID=A0A1Y2GTD8_9FUNG|nr:hypothetical protein BCR41DRAFT_369099 [Lobosporangium transversale]KAF9905674.1 hypothetical protein BX616_000959 [Lobosporangium transversale]ORZ22761.1 hypothetical protein BCR41DRAFT_369099 [Lobosporangium transversale]|eukprot:XP_021883315.1 hypothetical protein BCR41DRAFT_369099 [Lobosporangium transversale]
MIGLLLGTVKYHQIHTSETFTAHPYVSTAHRASLMYGFASFQLAGIALLSAWSEKTNVLATAVTQIFFVLPVIAYAIHGFLKDTTNQLKVPHKLGNKGVILPPFLIKLFMWSLIGAEIGGCGILCAGMIKTIATLPAITAMAV